MIGLSIDVDYFSYENLLWDWGHTESNPIYTTSAIWMIRHQYQDLFEECDVKHADIHPASLFNRLIEDGFSFSRKTKIGCGWSHRYAYDFFKPYKLDRIINIDAHHDMWERDVIDCGSWGYHLQKETGVKFKWVCPKHIYKDLDLDDILKYQAISINEIRAFAGKVGAIYICQSPVWLPPFNDEWYHFLIMAASGHCGRSNLTRNWGYVNRDMPSREEMERSRLECQEQIKQLFASNTKS